MNNSAYKSDNNPFRTIKSLKEKIKDFDLILTKADKGNCLVILKRSDYNSKVETFLKDNNFKILPTNPINKFTRQLNSILRTLSYFLDSHDCPKNLLPGNPITPRLYGLPKIHKLDCPIRPVVSFVNTPSCMISKFILNLIMQLTCFKPKNGIKNSKDFADKLHNFDLPNKNIMVSFDVTNLFTMVPRDEAVVMVKDLLYMKGVDTERVVNILSVLNICLKQNFFKFNNSCYEQEDGLAMGSCLSPFLAEVFMDFLENNYILTDTNKEIKFWARYVDDCFAILETDEGGSEFLLDKINHIHPKIKFTLEIENDSKLNFLDLTLSRNNNNKIDFSIFRKPTQTDHAIPSSSNHAPAHKMAAFRCYVHRLFNIPMSDSSFIQEANTIKQIAHNNGYDPEIVDTMIRKYKEKTIMTEAYNAPKPLSDSVFVIPFLSSHLTRSISRNVKQHLPEARIVYKNNLSLKSILVNSKDRLETLNKSGIYRLNCDDCEASYVGRTFRSLQIRLSEHLKRDTSAFGKHLSETGHNFDPGNGAKILHNITSRNHNRLDFMEDIEIEREMASNTNCLNTKSRLVRYYSPLYKRLLN